MDNAVLAREHGTLRKQLTSSAVCRRELLNLCKDYKVSLLLVFGSFARRENHSYSDLDLAYQRGNRFSFDERYEFLSKLRELLDVDYQYIDLIWLNGADPLHLKKIVEDAILLAGRKDTFKEFARMAFHRYSDYKPYLEREKTVNHRRIQRLKST